MQYSLLERSIASVLSRFPRLKSTVKVVYHRAVYFFYRRSARGKSLVLADGVHLEDVRGHSSNRELDESVWFGYYDRSPWSSDGRYFIRHRATDRSARCEVSVSEITTGHTVSVGNTRAWNHQQACLSSWCGSSPYTVAYNSIEDGVLGSRWVRLAQNGPHVEESTFVPWPVQSIHPNGEYALTLNYRRLHRLRPEYGYDFEVSNFAPNQPDNTDGMWRFDVRGGTAKLAVTLEQLRTLSPAQTMDGADHKVNHIMYSPNGERFVFMHRWIHKTGKYSRLLVGKDGTDFDSCDLRVLMDERVVSHYSWKNDRELIVWGRYGGHDRYFLIDVEQSSVEPLAGGLIDRYGDGHPSFSPDERYVITDTYPDKARMRTLILLDTKLQKVTELGKFFAPWKFNGAYRCDLHPRWSPDGKQVSIDSAHEGQRRSYIIDISGIVER